MTTSEAAALDETSLTAPLLDPTFYAGDPYPLYARLRTEAPVARNDEAGLWFVSRHAEVTEVSRHPETFCSGKGILVMEIGAEYETPPTMMHTDPPAHTRYRGLVQPGFRPSFMRALEDQIRARTRALVERIEPGRPVDVVADVTVPLPLQVISDLLGMPEDEWPRFYRWSEAAIPGATDWPEEERNALLGEMTAYLLEAAADRRAEPKHDIISELAKVGVEPDPASDGDGDGDGEGASVNPDGEGLTDSELAMFLVQLLVAGNETTRNMMSGGLAAFAETTASWSALRERWAASVSRAVPIAVEEMLRWTTPVISFMRTTTRPTSLAGRQLGPGEPVLMLYASANRDEAVFGNAADRFDPARNPNPHVAFGFGPHFCIGAVLARVEGQILLEELLTRFSTVELAGDVGRTSSPVIAGVTSAPLVFGAA